MNGYIGCKSIEKDGHTDSWIEGWMDRQIEERWIDGKLDRWKAAQMESWIDGKMDRWKDGEMDGWMEDRWIDDWVDGLFGGRIDQSTDR